MEVDTQAQGDEPASNTLQSTNTTDGCFKMPSNAQSTGANAKGDEATPPNGSVGQYVSAPPDADNTPPTAVVGVKSGGLLVNGRESERLLGCVHYDSGDTKTAPVSTRVQNQLAE